MEVYCIMVTLAWDDATITAFTEATGTFTFEEDDVRAIYVDWSDGTDPDNSFSNEKEYANYQWYTTTEPKKEVALTHTYTATGTFNPVIQVINSAGYVSKYQGAVAVGSLNPSGAVSPYFVTEGAMPSIAVADGEATGVMRVENKTVKSGIDNSIFEHQGGKTVYLMIPPLCTIAELTIINSITVEIEAVVDTSIISATDATAVGGASTNVQTLTTTMSSLPTTGGLQEVAVTGGEIKKILKVTYTNPKYVGASGTTSYTENSAYKNLKIFVVVSAQNPVGGAGYWPITYVSPGCPIKRADDSLRRATLNFSQSRAKASNVSISSYRYDNGKSWFSPVDQWWLGNNRTGLGDIITGNTFVDNTKTTKSSKDVSYTYGAVNHEGLNGSDTIASPAVQAVAFDSSANNKYQSDNSTSQKYRTEQFLIDDFGRFVDQYHLTRVSTEPSSSAANVSPINANKPEVFRIQPVGIDTTRTDANSNWSKIDRSTGVWSAGQSTVWTDEAWNNGMATGDMDTQGEDGGCALGMIEMNTNLAGSDWEDIAGNTVAIHNDYLLLLFPKKTNKIFFNISSYAHGLISKSLSGSSFDTPWSIADVSYLRIENSGTIKQDAYWEAVPFEDTTSVSREYRDTSNDKYVEQSNALSKSGYISFDMPLEWDKINLKKLCGGQFDTAMTTSTLGDNYDVVVSGTFTDLGSGASADFGGVASLTLLSGTNVSGAGDFEILGSGYGGDEDEIGAFKYIGFCQGTGADSPSTSPLKRPVWIASGTANGSKSTTGNGVDTLYLTYGDIGGGYSDILGAGGLASPTADCKFLIRRVNIYDVITGVSKVDFGVSDAVDALSPVDHGSSAFPSRYFASGGTAGGTFSTFATALTAAWKDTELYAVKVTLSGAAGLQSASLTGDAPVIYNVFDATEGFSAIIKEVDDSAYNLNALPITSDIGIKRGGTFYSAITRKGKVFISRTGDTIESIAFSSIALGNTGVADPFDSYSGDSTLYGQLRMIRRLHGNNVRVYWDEPQKDGTYIRYWGIITNINENHGIGGQQSVITYNFNVMIEEIALLNEDGVLMTDMFPLGGIADEKNFS